MRRDDGPKVLVIDDDPAVCQALSLHLRFRGMRVSTAANAKEGLAALRAGDLAVVLTDVGLPDLSGHEIVKTARAELTQAGFQPPEFIVMTANPTLDNAIAALEEGACHFLPKPVSTAFLDVLVQRALELGQLRAQVRGVAGEQRRLVLHSLRAVAEDVGLVGALEAVLRAAQVLLQPTAAVLWLYGSRHGETAVLTEPAGGTPSDEHESMARAAWEHGEPALVQGRQARYATQPILVDNRPEAVLCLEYAPGMEVPSDAERAEALEELALHAAGAIRKQRLFADLEQSALQIHSLFEVGLAMASERSLQRLFEVIVESAARICGAERCSLMVREPEGDLLRIRAARGIPADVISQVTVKIGEGIAGSVAATGDPLYIADIEHHDRFGRHNGDQYRNSSLVCVPILVSDQAVGVLNVSNKSDGSSFTNNDLNLMTLLAGQAAVAVDNAERYQDLSAKAITDGLTGVYLRRYFDECLERAWQTLGAGGHGFSVLMLDIDHFKRVNDTWGHQVGDVALQVVAQAILAGVRDDDLVARYGGEEFAVVLAAPDAQIAASVAERIRKSVEAATIVAGAASFQVTISIGVAVPSEDSGSAAKVLEAADRALYAAKEGGRNRVELATL